VPLRRPRRIFRPAALPVPSRGMAVTAALGLAVAGLATVILMSTNLFGRAPASSGSLDADAAQVAVVDGGTLRMKNRVVRLLGVAPPERGETCKARDGSGFDCGVAATNALAALVRETPVACQLRGQDPMGRPLAVCEASGTELNRALVAGGWARADREEPRLKSEEAAARTQRRGLWATDTW
jgi:endonuclease YncB( thermonuclease family)